MSVAYLVMVHDDPDQAARLVRRLTSAEDLVLVHVDRKVDIEPFTAAFARAGVDPLLVRRRVWVAWGGWSIVRAELAGMREAVRSGFAFSHLVVLSGKDWPIRSRAETRALFDAHPGTSFLSWSFGDVDGYDDEDRRGNATWRWSGDLHRLTSWCVDVRGRRWYLPDSADPRARWLPRRRIPRGLRAAQGSAWWNLSAEAVHEVLRTLRRRPGLALWFRFVFAPDENVMQMLLLGSPLRDRLVNEDLRFMHWSGNHPPALGLDDVDEMRASLKHFARKFDGGASRPVLDRLDALAGEVPAPAPRSNDPHPMRAAT